MSTSLTRFFFRLVTSLTHLIMHYQLSNRQTKVVNCFRTCKLYQSQVVWLLFDRSIKFIGQITQIPFLKFWHYNIYCYMNYQLIILGSSIFHAEQEASDRGRIKQSQSYGQVNYQSCYTWSFLNTNGIFIVLPYFSSAYMQIMCNIAFRIPNNTCFSCFFFFLYLVTSGG